METMLLRLKSENYQWKSTPHESEWKTIKSKFYRSDFRLLVSSKNQDTVLICLLKNFDGLCLF